jgi:hypothetical protein
MYVTPRKITVDVLCPSCSVESTIDITHVVEWDQKDCDCCGDEVVAYADCPNCDELLRIDVA